MRRANDVSQDSGFCPAPSAGKHDDPEFGTHHARDAVAPPRDDRLEAAGSSPPPMKLNTQYMHTLWFDLEFTRPTHAQEALDRSAPTAASR